VEIREVRPEEYPEAGRVTALAYLEFVPPGPGWDDWQGYLSEIGDVAGRVDRTVVLAAVEGGRILGTATIEVDRTLGDDDVELPSDAASLRMLGVNPEARGKGVGRALVEACIERARAAGKRTMLLRTVGRMVAAQRLYASMGFERDPDRDLSFEDGGGLLAFRLDISSARPVSPEEPGRGAGGAAG